MRLSCVKLNPSRFRSGTTWYRCFRERRWLTLNMQWGFYTQKICKLCIVKLNLLNWLFSFVNVYLFFLHSPKNCLTNLYGVIRSIMMHVTTGARVTRKPKLQRSFDYHSTISPQSLLRFSSILFSIFPPVLSNCSTSWTSLLPNIRNLTIKMRCTQSKSSKTSLRASLRFR